MYGVVQAFTGPGPDGADQAGTDTSSSAPPSTSPSASASPSGGGSSAVAQAPRGKVTVEVHATDRSWVQVTTATGQELFQGLLQAGAQQSFTDKTRLRLVIGNAGGVTLAVNGTEIGTPGDRARSPGCSSPPRTPPQADASVRGPARG